MSTLTNPWKRALALLVAFAIALVSRAASAVTFDLRAAETTLVMADGTPVPMWGFGLLGDPDVSIPGPVLDVPVGDTTLIVNLTNDLPVPVSIVIPGLPAPLTPVWDDGTTGPRTTLQQRAVSFTQVVPPGGTGTYQWSGVRPGTHLYQSGAHPAVQVPMGLYGVVRHDAAPGVAYGAPGQPTYTPFDEDTVLVYSEIDPQLNTAVTTGTYGTDAYPTTVDYRPRYFLINGQPISAAPQLQVDVHERRLLRLVNAGLRSITPSLTGGTMTLLAEDGYPVRFPREAYSVLLPAGKTRDALVVRTGPGSAVLFDRRSGIRIAEVIAELAAGSPVAANDGYSVDEDSPAPLSVGAPGVLGNDTGAGLTAVLDSGPVAGTLQLLADGSFTFAPPPDFAGVATFTYHAEAGGLKSNVVTVAITVNPVPDPPVAADDAYEAVAGETLLIPAPGVLANDTDVDTAMLTAQLVPGPSSGTLVLAPDGSFEYTPGAPGISDIFVYQAWDGSALSNQATITITVLPPSNDPPVAVDDFASTQKNTPVIINLVLNDSDPDGNLAPGTVSWTAPTRGGTVSVNPNPGAPPGTVQFSPKHNFKGTDTFTYVVSDTLGLVSAPATVRVNVLK